MNKGKKNTTLKKLKIAADNDKREYSKEHYAVALKYDYKLSEAQNRFEALISAKQLSDFGKIEYAGLLLKTRNFKRVIEVLNSIESSDFNDKRKDYLIQIAHKLENESCIEFSSGEQEFSSYCYTFDASASIEPRQNEIIYTWSFDEKDSINGAVVDYCFEISGKHKVTLGSYDAINEVHNADSSFSITITPPLDFESMQKNNIIGKSINFQYKEELSEGQDIVWHFGNGIFKSGKKVEYYFNRPGNYYIEFYVIEGNQKDKLPPCSSSQLFINNSKAEKKKKE